MAKSSNIKSDQLITLLKKPNGTRISVLTENLGWQAHTVRAAISRLRKKGFDVTRTKAKKSGEAIYCINRDTSSCPKALKGELASDG